MPFSKILDYLRSLKTHSKAPTRYKKEIPRYKIFNSADTLVKTQSGYHLVKRLNQYFESMGLQILSDLEFVEKQIKQTGFKKEFVKIHNYMNRLPRVGGGNGTIKNIGHDKCLRNLVYCSLHLF